MKKIRNIVLSVLFFIGLGACLADEYSDAKTEIETAYVLNIPRPDGSAISCHHQSIDKREFILCEIMAVGSRGFRGLWEVVGKDKPVFYALNGKALQALDRFGGLPNFKKHPKPTEVDIPAVLEQFK